MTIVVGYSSKPEGAAALQHAGAEARLRNARVVLVPNTAEEDLAPVAEALTDVEHEIVDSSPDGQLGEHLVQVAEDEGAELIVIGLRRRSPTGKLLLGLNAQRILLDAGCPVHAVKARD